MSGVGEAFTTLDLKSPMVEQVIRVWKGSHVDKSHGHVESLSQLEATSESGKRE